VIGSFARLVTVRVQVGPVMVVTTPCPVKTPRTRADLC